MDIHAFLRHQEEEIELCEDHIKRLLDKPAHWDFADVARDIIANEAEVKARKAVAEVVRRCVDNGEDPTTALHLALARKAQRLAERNTCPVKALRATYIVEYWGRIVTSWEKVES